MASHIGVPHFDSLPRPSLYRSRSHSNPSPNATDPQSATERPTRPSHGRSQSYLSPADPQPRNANTLPTPSATLERSTLERASSRLHLPGKHHLHHDHRKHRYTQSEEQHLPRKSKDRDTDGLPNLVAGLNAERTRRAAGSSQNEGPPAHYESAGGLTRMMSHRSGRGPGGVDTAYVDVYGRYGAYHRYGGPSDLRRRATSDPRAPHSNQQQRVKSTVELDLERAERVKRQRRFTVTQADLTKRDKEIEEAEEEMREKLEQIHSSGIDITRRLDYGYYNLLEKVGNLVETIQSFQTLSSQSAQLAVNFENESNRLDKDIQRRISGFKAGFEGREARVARLEARGRGVQTKAEDLGRRLENARVMVENWEKREDRARKVWGRFWGWIFWSLISIFVFIAGLVMWKEWWFRGDPVKAGIGVPFGGHWNQSLKLGDGGEGERLLRQVNLPEEVRTILEGIEFRNRQRKDFVTPLSATDEGVIGSGEDDERLAVLDEL